MAVTINGSAGVTTNSGAVYNGIAAGTAVASTSGTSIDFTSIPSWVRRVTVMLNGVSTSGTSNPLFQLGAGSVTTSGYASSSAITGGSGVSTGAGFTTGFGVNAGNAANLINGHIVFTLISGSTWVGSSILGVNSSGTHYSAQGGGSIALSGTLDRVRITTVNGTDTFDAGSINILYE